MILIYIVISTLVFIAAVVVFSVLNNFYRTHQLRQLQRVFREYNQQGNFRIVIEWIKGADPNRQEGRFLRAFEYLEKIERDDLLLELADAFPFDHFTHRHVRFPLARLYSRNDRHEDAVNIAVLLRRQFPNDDSTLDLFADLHLEAGRWQEAKAELVPRLQRKHKGTIFNRHYARILAHEGKLQEAIDMMHNVVKKVHTLSKNTFLQPQKGLIQKQYERDLALLESLEDAKKNKG